MQDMTNLLLNSDHKVLSKNELIEMPPLALAFVGDAGKIIIIVWIYLLHKYLKLIYNAILPRLRGFVNGKKYFCT